jgi:hypothetical protein
VTDGYWAAYERGEQPVWDEAAALNQRFARDAHELDRDRWHASRAVTAASCPLCEEGNAR